MNDFYEHHKDSMKFGYRCFDRLLLNSLIQPFQQPDRVIGFFQCLSRWRTCRAEQPLGGSRAIPELGQEPE